MTRPLLPVLLACTWLAACASDPPPPPATVPVEDKLDGKLIELLQLHETGPAKALGKRLKALEAEGILHEGVSVKVDITATSSAVVPALDAALKKAGGRSETSFENTLYGWVPIPALRSYAMQAEVWTIKVSVPSTSPIAAPTGSTPDGRAKQGVTHGRLQKPR